MVTYAPSASTTTTYNRAKYKPHDKTIMRVAKSAFNAAAANIPADAQTVNCATIPANSIILAVNIDVTTAEGADTGADIGLTGGAEFASDANMAVATQSVVLGVPYLLTSAKKVTLSSCAAALNNCIVDIYTTYVELDSLSVAN